MIENKNLPAYPQPIAECNGGISDARDYSPESSDISKREYFAGLAMQGLLANPDYNCPSRPKDIVTTMNTAKAALHYADALLAELSKPQP